MLACSDYDYIEIVCMFHYPLKISQKSGEVIVCIAQDTARNEAREEVIKVTAAGKEQLVVLDEIATLEVLVDNPHFQKISFI